MDTPQALAIQWVCQKLLSSFKMSSATLKILQAVPVAEAALTLASESKQFMRAVQKNALANATYPGKVAEFLDRLRKYHPLPQWVTAEVMMQTTLSGTKSAEPKRFEGESDSLRTKWDSSSKPLMLKEYLPLYYEMFGDTAPSAAQLMQYIEQMRQRMWQLRLLQSNQRKEKAKVVKGEPPGGGGSADDAHEEMDPARDSDAGSSAHATVPESWLPTDILLFLFLGPPAGDACVPLFRRDWKGQMAAAGGMGFGGMGGGMGGGGGDAAGLLLLETRRLNAALERRQRVAERELRLRELQLLVKYSEGDARAQHQRELLEFIKRPWGGVATAAAGAGLPAAPMGPAFGMGAVS
ncbi:hypothetical protein JKP88DRAFT_263211 [Tribonema minus]|uniref:Uncharacterized protein n=1 Tax=Tribonema minus TaxID=303371 RepID=A0A835YWU6_9STRA|nr:hypothetical protein JKP88DRAFT_263211 [Tribonema minus]